MDLLQPHTRLSTDNVFSPHDRLDGVPSLTLNRPTLAICAHRVIPGTACWCSALESQVRRNVCLEIAPESRHPGCVDVSPEGPLRNTAAGETGATEVVGVVRFVLIVAMKLLIILQCTGRPSLLCFGLAHRVRSGLWSLPALHRIPPETIGGFYPDSMV